MKKKNRKKPRKRDWVAELLVTTVRPKTLPSRKLYTRKRLKPEYSEQDGGELVIPTKAPTNHQEKLPECGAEQTKP